MRERRGHSYFLFLLFFFLFLIVIVIVIVYRLYHLRLLDRTESND